MEQSNKHSPRIDDQLEHELEPLVRSGSESRVEEGFEQQGAADGEPTSGYRITEPDGPFFGLGPDAATARRELSRHLGSHVFPAEREALIADAVDRDAPEAALRALRELPEGVTFETLHTAWEAIAGPIEEEDDPRGA